MLCARYHQSLDIEHSHFGASGLVGALQPGNRRHFMFARKEQPAGNRRLPQGARVAPACQLVYRVVYLGKHARLD